MNTYYVCKKTRFIDQLIKIYSNERELHGVGGIFKWSSLHGIRFICRIFHHFSFAKWNTRLIGMQSGLDAPLSFRPVLENLFRR